MKLANSYSKSLLLLSSINQDRTVGLQLFMRCLILQRIWNSRVQFVSHYSLRLYPAFNSSLLPSSTQLSSSTPQIILYERKVSNPGTSLPHTILFLFSLGLQHPCRQPTQLASHVFFLLNVTIKRYTHLMSLSNAAHSSLINIFYPQLSNYFLNASQYYFPNFPWTFPLTCSCQFPNDNAEWCYFTARFNSPTNLWEPVLSLFLDSTSHLAEAWPVHTCRASSTHTTVQTTSTASKN